jgi:hypothetical protein
MSEVFGTEMHRRFSGKGQMMIDERLFSGQAGFLMGKRKPELNQEESISSSQIPLDPRKLLRYPNNFKRCFFKYWGFQQL